MKFKLAPSWEVRCFKLLDTVSSKAIHIPPSTSSLIAAMPVFKGDNGSGSGVDLPIAQSDVTGLPARLIETETLLDQVKNLAEINQLNIGLKASLADLNELESQVELNRIAILSKATVAELLSLTQIVSSKADSSEVSQQIADLLQTDSQLISSLQTLSAALEEDQDILEALETTVANRVRFDTSNQNLNSLQKYNARTNIGAEEQGTASQLLSSITAQSLGAATATQGAKADSALQSGDVAPVALTGNYYDLVNRPRNMKAGYWYNFQGVATNTSTTFLSTISNYNFFRLLSPITISKLNVAFSAGATGRSIKVRFYDFATEQAVSPIYEWAAVIGDYNEFILPEPLTLPAGEYYLATHNNGANSGNSTIRSIDATSCAAMPLTTLLVTSGATQVGHLVSSTYAASLPQTVPTTRSPYTGNQPLIQAYVSG